MIAIIVGLIIALIVIVVVVNAIQQHKEKIDADKRMQVSKQKAVIDESEELILSMGNLPPNPKLVEILCRRSVNAAKTMFQIRPDGRIKKMITELQSRLKAAEEMAQSPHVVEESFILPDNEQHLIAILQSIKKLRAMLKSEQAKGAVDAQTFINEDHRLDSMQLKISIESLMKRAAQAYGKELIGSARQYYEKALMTIQQHSHKTEYTQAKQVELEEKLNEITSQLKTSNDQDRAKKEKAEEDDIDMLFQPKKKW